MAWAGAMNQLGKVAEGESQRRSSEIGACVELGENIFTINSGNKVRDGDTPGTPTSKICILDSTAGGDNNINWDKSTRQSCTEGENGGQRQPVQSTIQAHGRT